MPINTTTDGKAGNAILATNDASSGALKNDTSVFQPNGVITVSFWIKRVV